ncbi:kinase-like domain-containing protein [Tricharina praecox]|uniref:kinase-like domain-containing protein n=1 Tax=Tricharina praecox TaxID=43433 RepID=UPI00221EF057|nr:kinase-like domain-containing protein [Tricharina praecox]KAI5849148.1 kinase-like domain-containing protein [Tricharina praecox]
MAPFSTESILLYRRGGYHPVHLRDRIYERYVIEHKLRHDSRSTTWVARDLKKNRLVSIRIFIAAVSEEGYTEAEVLFHLRPEPAPPRSVWQRLGGLWVQDQPKPQASFFPALLDHFTISGPNGDHRCIVSEVLGNSIGDLMEDPVQEFEFPMNAARKIGVKMVHAVAELHSRQVVHGSLNPRKFSLTIPGVDSWTPEELRKYFGEPSKLIMQDLCNRHRFGGRRYEPRPSPQRPEYLVESPPLIQLTSLCLESPGIKITTFNTAFYYIEGDEVHKTILTQPSFASPEIQCHDVLTPACDIWSLGCVLHHIFSNNYMWVPLTGCYQDTLIDLTLCFAKLPEPWWSRWSDRARYFNEYGHLMHHMAADGGAVPKGSDLISRICYARMHREGVHGMGGEEFEWFRHVMIGIFRLLPSERFDAKEVVRYLPPRWLDEVEKDEGRKDEGRKK